MAKLTLTGIRKSFGPVEIIKGVDLAVEDGELVVFVGPSGCGKSTLLRIIAGLEDMSDGAVHIGGADVGHLPPAKRGIAMVFQSYALYPHMSVFDNMAFGLRQAGTARESIRAKVQEASRILQLDALLKRRPRQLSGGQRQRVAIGRAIVRDPQVFLFDEPLSNLDAALRVKMRIEIAKLHAELAATMVYVTHDQVEAMTLADRIVVLDQGEVAQVGTPLELYHAPANRFVAGFIGSPRMNFVSVTVAQTGPDGVAVQMPDGGLVTVPVVSEGFAAGQKAELGIRPEHLTEGDDLGLLRGRVDVVERLGGATFLYLSGPLDEELLVVEADGDSETMVGDQVAVALRPDLCHLFDPDGRAARHLRPHRMTAMRRRPRLH
ncbi:MAG: ABC transporter ATP-binding protein [Inquilinaceae bacterium]